MAIEYEKHTLNLLAGQWKACQEAGEELGGINPSSVIRAAIRDYLLALSQVDNPNSDIGPYGCRTQKTPGPT